MTKAHTLKELKEEFLISMGINYPDLCGAMFTALDDSINSSVWRNKTYKDKKVPRNKRIEFKNCWKHMLCHIATQYDKDKSLVQGESPVSGEQHCENIRRIRAVLSRKFHPILINRRLRIGSAQKSLNLYLKYRWCLGEIDTPPHCTVDNVILKKVYPHNEIPSWTECDSIDDYKCWIEKIKDKAGAQPLAEWELREWGDWKREKDQVKG